MTAAYGLVRQVLASNVICISFMIMGMAVGWPSPVLYTMRQTGKPLCLTSLDTTLMVTLFYVGNVVMPVPCGLLADLIGRKASLLTLTVFPLSSWVLIYFAKHSSMLDVARLLAGMWSGLIYTVGPLYIGEIAEPRMRGALSTMATVQCNLGLVFAYVFGRAVSYWTVAVTFGAVPVVFFIMLIFIPESPYWLVYKGQLEKAAKSLKWLRGGKSEKEVQEELNELIKSVESDLSKPAGFRMLFKSAGNRKALIIVLVISICQRFSGVSAIIAYTAIILPNKKVLSLTPNDCAIVISIFWLVTVIVVYFVVDKVGRLPLLIFSSGGCALSLLTACLWFFVNQTTHSTALHWIPFASFLLYGCFFNTGIGPLTTTLQGEMFSARLKAVASGVTAIVQALASIVVNATFLPIADNLGVFLNFALYAATCVGFIIFVSCYMFETNRQSLQQIQEKLHGTNT